MYPLFVNLFCQFRIKYYLCIGNNRRTMNTSSGSHREDVINQVSQLRNQVVPSAKMILFGSQARGDAHAESDWDFVMLLKKDRVTLEDFDRYAFPFVELGWSMGEYFSVKQFTLEDWARRANTPFYQNVLRDGIEL